MGFVKQIRGSRIDPDQTVSEKLSWIELPGTS